MKTLILGQRRRRSRVRNLAGRRLGEDAIGDGVANGAREDICWKAGLRGKLFQRDCRAQWHLLRDLEFQDGFEVGCIDALQDSPVR